MEDYNDVVLSCDHPYRVVAAMNALGPRLPLEVRKRLNRVFISYVHHHGPEGAFERMNGRSIGVILAEYESASLPRSITSGGLDGVRYDLFAAPDEKTEGRASGA